MREEKLMSRQTKNFFLATILLAASLCAFSTAAVCQSSAQATAPAASAQQTFATPQLALQALIDATTDYNVPTLMKIFGPEGEDFIESKDQVRDENNGKAFAKLAKEKSSVSIDPKNPNRATIVAGNENWPVPVPLIKRNGKWIFDSKVGRREILYRRIGANELDAIQVCHGYVEAQKEYASEIHDNSGINQYAQKIISTPGKQDGLYWTNADGSPGGPIGEAVAKAIAEGYSSKLEPYHGYYFKILKGQGPAAAPIGKINYVIEGVMIGGFALVAVPAEYLVTGVKSFIISNDGIVYQKDLGEKSLDIFKTMEIYNPDKTWQATDDQWPAGAWVSNLAGHP